MWSQRVVAFLMVGEIAWLVIVTTSTAWWPSVMLALNGIMLATIPSGGWVAKRAQTRTSVVQNALDFALDPNIEAAIVEAVRYTAQHDPDGWREADPMEATQRLARGVIDRLASRAIEDASR